MNLARKIISISLALIFTTAGSANAAGSAAKSWIPFPIAKPGNTSQALQLSKLKRSLDAFYRKLLNSADKRADIPRLPFDRNFQAYAKAADGICAVILEPYCGLGNPAFDVQEYSPILSFVNSNYTSFSALETQSNRILIIVEFNAYPEKNSSEYLRTIIFPLGFKDGNLKIHDIVNLDSDGRESSALQKLISESQLRQ